MRDDFNQKTKSLLSRRVGFKCSNPNCRHLTDGSAKGAIKYVSIGEAEIMFPSEWTSYGNARRYSFHKSAWSYIHSGNIDDEIQIVKLNHRELPFTDL